MDINQIIGIAIMVLCMLNVKRMLMARRGEKNKGYLFLNLKAIIVNLVFGLLIGIALLTKIFKLF